MTTKSFDDMVSNGDLAVSKMGLESTSPLAATRATVRATWSSSAMASHYHRGVLKTHAPAKVAEFKAAHPGVKWKGDHIDRQRNHNCIKNLRVDADFVVRAYGWNCGQLYTENLMSLRPKSYHWIKAVINIELLKERFASLDYYL